MRHYPALPSLFVPAVRALALAAALPVLSLAHSQTATAQAYIKQAGRTRPSDTSVTPMLGFSGIYGVEAGGKMDYLLANPGFIPHLNNSVFIEGAVFIAEDGGPFVAPLLRWEFHLHPEWTVSGEAGIEANLGADDDDDWRHRHRRRRANLSFAAGAQWRVPGKDLVMRAEVDHAHDALRLGPVIAF